MPVMRIVSCLPATARASVPSFTTRTSHAGSLPSTSCWQVL